MRMHHFDTNDRRTRLMEVKKIFAETLTLHFRNYCGLLQTCIISHFSSSMLIARENSYAAIIEHIDKQS